jgi:hypothetical protein
METPIQERQHAQQVQRKFQQARGAQALTAHQTKRPSSQDQFEWQAERDEEGHDQVARSQYLLL